MNHCVSLYPSEDDELELNQIDYLRRRYPDHVIGLSTHEYHDWHSSMLISYARARAPGSATWTSRHDGKEVSSYCSLPEQTDGWFKAFHKARGDVRRLGRLPARGHPQGDRVPRRAGPRRLREARPGTDYVFSSDTFDRDFYLAIPLQKGQLSCREVMNGEKLVLAIQANEPLTINHIDGPYNENATLRSLILARGI